MERCLAGEAVVSRGKSREIPSRICALSRDACLFTLKSAARQYANLSPVPCSRRPRQRGSAPRGL